MVSFLAGCLLTFWLIRVPSGTSPAEKSKQSARCLLWLPFGLLLMYAVWLLLTAPTGLEFKYRLDQLASLSWMGGFIVGAALGSVARVLWAQITFHILNSPDAAIVFSGCRHRTKCKI